MTFIMWLTTVGVHFATEEQNEAIGLNMEWTFDIDSSSVLKPIWKRPEAYTLNSPEPHDMADTI